MGLSDEEKSFVPFAGLVFLFPLGMASVQHYSSTLLVVMFLCGIWCLFADRERISVSNLWIICAFIVFCCVISLSLLNAVDLRSGFKILSKMAYIFVLVPLYSVTQRHPVGFLKAFFWGLVFAGPLNLFVAFYSVYIQDLPRAKGFYNAIVFGDLMLLGAMLLSVFILSGFFKGRLHSLLGNISIVSFLLSCFLSGTLGAWIALPFALAATLFLFRERLNRKILIQMLVGSTLLLIIIFTLPSISRIYGEEYRTPHRKLLSAMEQVLSYNQDKELESSVGQRLIMWGVAFDMFMESPLFGSGLGGFERESEKLIANNETALVKPFAHAHSIFFEFLGTTGILGFLAMVACLFIVPAAVFIRALSGSESQRFSASAGLVFLACFAVFGLTECWLYRSPMLMTYIVCLLIFTTGCSEREMV